MATTVLDVLKKKLLDLRELRTEATSTGQPKDWTDYRQCVGEIRGLDLALSELEILDRRLKEAEDE